MSITLKFKDISRDIFEKEAHYWFLEGFFNDLAEKTEQQIDLYGDARFEGNDTETLISYIEAARVAVEQREDSFKQRVGFNVSNEPIDEIILKEKLLTEIDTILDYAKKAREHNVALEFLGD